TAEGRWLLRERVRRRASYNAWRDTLVVAVAGLWMLFQGEALTADALTTTLVLAYRASASLSTVVQARRLCLGNLPGYEALSQRREQLIPRQGDASNQTIAEASLIGLSTARLSQLHWSSSANASTGLRSLDLSANGLVALTGPSGSGNSTLYRSLLWVAQRGRQLLAAELGLRHLATERAGRGAADASADCLCPSERGAV
ncbi:MAG: hypothetical protein OXU17_08140, partial [Cyanobacteria bacterium MAG STY1_bin_7]|nr:hypothetical protein [Cyanobacteria bacterium MAG STY1_bin_7]